MNIAEIKNNDISNGEGVRVSVFVSGCTHKCKGCFNYMTWDFNYGYRYTSKIESEILSLLNHEYISGLSLLGGEPFEPCNQRELVGLLRRVRREMPDENIWCYTGYTLEELMLKKSRARCEVTDKMLSYIDILVDGEFVEGLKDITLKFKGSSNQRVIDLKNTLKNNEIILYE